MTDYRDLNVNAAPTNPLITNSEGLQSQVMMTNMGTIIATDIGTIRTEKQEVLTHGKRNRKKHFSIRQ